MKLTAKLTALVLALAMLLCGVAMAETETKTLIVGTNPEFSPFEYIGDDGSVIGIDIDFINALLAKIGYVGTIESVEWNGLIPAMGSGKIDMIISGMTITEERKQSVLFSDPYFDATQSIIVPTEGAVIAAEADMHGKKLGVVMGYTGDLYITDNFTDSEITRYQNGVDAVQDLVNGKLDAVVLDEAPAKVLAEQAGTLTVLEDRLSNEQYGIALPLDATELAAQLNAGIAEMKENGELQAITDKYMAAE